MSDSTPAPQPPTEPSQGDSGAEGEVAPAWWRQWKYMLPLWLAIVLLAGLALHYEVDTSIVAGGMILVGIATHAFTWLLGVIALVPVVGPLVANLLSASFIWLLNAVGYLVAYVAIRRGYSKDVLTYRGLTLALILGIVLGYILGKLF